MELSGGNKLLILKNFGGDSDEKYCKTVLGHFLVIAKLFLEICVIWEVEPCFSILIWRRSNLNCIPQHHCSLDFKELQSDPSFEQVSFAAFFLCLLF